jgi:hypothetical protein
MEWFGVLAIATYNCSLFDLLFATRVLWTRKEENGRRHGDSGSTPESMFLRPEHSALLGFSESFTEFASNQRISLAV